MYDNVAGLWVCQTKGPGATTLHHRPQPGIYILTAGKRE